MPTDPRIQVIQAPSLQAGIGGQDLQQQVLSGKLGERQMTINEQQLALQRQAAEQQRQINTQQMKMAQDKLALDTTLGMDRNRISLMRAKAEQDSLRETRETQVWREKTAAENRRLDNEQRAKLLVEAQQTGRVTRAETEARTAGLKVATGAAKDKADYDKMVRDVAFLGSLSDMADHTLRTAANTQKLRVNTVAAKRITKELVDTQGAFWAKNQMRDQIVGAVEMSLTPAAPTRGGGRETKSIVQIAADNVYRDYIKAQTKEDPRGQFTYIGKPGDVDTGWPVVGKDKNVWREKTYGEKLEALHQRIATDPEFASKFKVDLVKAKDQATREFMRTATGAMTERHARVLKQIRLDPKAEETPTAVALGILRDLGSSGNHAADLLQQGLQKGEVELVARPWDSSGKLALMRTYTLTAEILEQGDKSQQAAATVIRGKVSDLMDPNSAGSNKRLAKEWEMTYNRIDPRFDAHALDDAMLNAHIAVQQGIVDEKIGDADLKALTISLRKYITAAKKNPLSDESRKLYTEMRDLHTDYLLKYGNNLSASGFVPKTAQDFLAAGQPKVAQVATPAAKEALVKAPSVEPPAPVVVPAGGG